MRRKCDISLLKKQELVAQNSCSRGWLERALLFISDVPSLICTKFYFFNLYISVHSIGLHTGTGQGWRRLKLSQLGAPHGHRAP